jgi:hypothetical protein
MCLGANEVDVSVEPACTIFFLTDFFLKVSGLACFVHTGTMCVLFRM